jgi:hypothetical protein
VREVLGPRDRTVREVVAALGPRIGVPGLSYLRVPDQAVVEALVAAGLPADVADLQVRMNAAFNRGAVRSLAGRSPATASPTEFETWADVGSADRGLQATPGGAATSGEVWAGPSRSS